MGTWVPPVVPPSLFVRGTGIPESSFSPTPQALAGSRTHFCPTAAAREQGKRVLHPSTTPPPSLLAPAKSVAFLAPLDNLNMILFFS